MKIPKANAIHEIEDKENQVDGLALAVPLPISWQPASFMAVQNS
jgi:hypothetical protein